ncbi:hypothetical protein HMPREF3213_02088 [Heyndrickxia coagulans]|uniref:Uncharacterized protein n=1 Tax=Heyndrickxia coagulans TaxID=1398 RepID=A0A133KNR3_HEYCO|nr:hypothetical protein HMPREF3213_02088 [Heyndrickxia coagulans]
MVTVKNAMESKSTYRVGKGPRRFEVRNFRIKNPPLQANVCLHKGDYDHIKKRGSGLLC